MKRSPNTKDSRTPRKGNSERPAEGLKRFVSRFLSDTGLSIETPRFEVIPGDGSKRLFRRILLTRTGYSLILMENRPLDEYLKKENLAYLKIGRHLAARGVPVPEIHRYDLEKGWFLMDDLGKTSLQDWASSHADREPMYKNVIEILFRMQTEGMEGFDPNWTCQTKKYDRQVMRRYESDYFLEAFLNGYLGMKRDWAGLNASFDYLADEAGKTGDLYFLYRDFQSRNILIDRGKIGLVDWQGGRLGPLGYDLASLLIDPYVGLAAEEREPVFRHYLHLLETELPSEAETFKRSYPYLAVQRNLQILGAFSFLSKVRGKTYFEAYIPPALNTLSQLLDDLGDAKLLRLHAFVKSLVHEMPTPSAHA